MSELPADHLGVANELRRDPLSGRWTAIAPDRARRPGAKTRVAGDTAGTTPEDCPFCEGHEDRTPPETYAVARGPRDPDTPGWTARVVPNLYPALKRQEVVVNSPRHVFSVADLQANEIEAVAKAWSARAQAGHDEGLGYLHAFVNEGRQAGASLAHSHSQLAWLRDRPPAVVEEESGGCRVCDWLPGELADGTRTVAERDGVALLAAYAGRLPYEALIVPRDHPEGSAFGARSLPTALALLVEAARRIRTLEGPVPLNAWLHDGGHWHLELLPRTAVLAGLELGAGVYVNTLAPEEAAEHLRSAAEAG
jgi:UDPglucose--hexose-1-phosphate uridylyltransferase